MESLILRSTRSRAAIMEQHPDSRMSPTLSIYDIFARNSSKLEIEAQHKSGSSILVKQVNYNLNKEKAIVKKLAASNRQADYTIRSCDGSHKNLMLHFQAGLYEFVRKAAHFYYIKANSYCYETDITALQERSSGHIVQTTYKTRKRGNGQIAYSLNLYHTKSAILINGKMATEFLDKDWPSICRIINEYQESSPKGVNHMTLNEGIKLSLQKLSKDLELRNWSTDMAVEAPTENGGSQTTMVGTTTPRTKHTADDTSTEPIEPHSNSPTVKRLAITYDQDASNTMEPESQVIGNGKTLLQTNTETRLEKTASQTPHSAPQNLETLVDRVQIHRSTVTGTNTPISQRPVIITHDNPQAHKEKQIQRCPPDDSYHHQVTPEASRQAEQTNSIPMCNNCRQLNADWIRAQQDFQSKEKKLSSLEKSLKSREKEIEKQVSQLETQKAVIVGLETKIKELTATNRLLQQALEMTPPTTPITPTWTNSQPLDQQSALQREVTALKEELRFKDMEARLVDRISNMEHRLLTNQLMQPQHHHPQHYPMMFHFTPHTPPMAYGPPPQPTPNQHLWRQEQTNPSQHVWRQEHHQEDRGSSRIGQRHYLQRDRGKTPQPHRPTDQQWRRQCDGTSTPHSSNSQSRGTTPSTLAVSSHEANLMSNTGIDSNQTQVLPAQTYSQSTSPTSESSGLSQNDSWAQTPKHHQELSKIMVPNPAENSINSDSQSRTLD